MKDYLIHKSQIIIDYQDLMIRDLYLAHSYFKKNFPNNDSTWAYKYYNIFSVTSPSPTFYTLFKDLSLLIREYVNHDRPLWMQSWLNYHMPDEVLDWHGHNWSHHGYISIDPKKTKTVFEEYEINNEIGNIYIGPGARLHKVEVLETFSSPRITIGFDITDEPNIPNEQFSLVPVL